ncbi:hypothetical protein [Phytoactinopolyspora limicola]|uniref:hypothetical protein n=1 Tax=Phytoactinopolyspora limicola TaxID=2715536 RepID=UPI00140B0636|nr:hypothetical protein [Phytoactinopolyspora limicola]
MARALPIVALVVVAAVSAAACAGSDGRLTVTADGPVLSHTPQSDESNAAELSGVLIMDGACLRVEASVPTGQEVWTVIFPAASWEGDSDVLRTADLTFTLGGPIRVGGGYYEPGSLVDDDPDLPCLTGRYFVAGSVDHG